MSCQKCSPLNGVICGACMSAFAASQQAQGLSPALTEPTAARAALVSPEERIAAALERIASSLEESNRLTRVTDALARQKKY